MPRLTVLLLALGLGLAAGAPLARPWLNPLREAGGAFPGWPTQWEGRALMPVPLTIRDAGFAQGFPGRVARFTDGRRAYVVRWTDGPTRRLHPASDCFKAIGYAVEPLPMSRRPDGRTMSCFAATRPGEALTVCEQLRSPDGRTWPDVSSWYWAALADRKTRSWWSWVTVERRSAA
jgi:hypothetical protein